MEEPVVESQDEIKDSKTAEPVEQEYISENKEEVTPDDVDYVETKETVTVKSGNGRWECIEGLWYYYDENGDRVQGWQKIDGKQYYFDEWSEVMCSGGMYEIDGKNYYFKASGELVIGWYKDVLYTWEDDKGITREEYGWYAADSNGVLLTGWQKIDGKWYYFDPDGCYMYSGGMYEIDGKDYYFKDSGALVIGWYEDVDTWEDEGITHINSNWYGTDGSGVLLTDWQKINGKWYYFDPMDHHMYYDGIWEIDGKEYAFTYSGAMVTGWYQDWDGWYYYEDSGVAAEGWKKINNKWYYFECGRMYEDGTYKCSDGKYYLFKSSGEWVASSGWYFYSYNGGNSGDWYYLESDGSVRASGWSKINGSWYYLSPYSGYMYSEGSYLIKENGKDVLYLFDASGKWINEKGWYQSAQILWGGNTDVKEINWYYIENGKLTTGLKTINGKQYYFYDGDGSMASGTYIIEKGTKYFAEDSGALSAISKGWKKGSRTYVVNGKTEKRINWFYFGSNGTEYAGWIKSGKAWYYIERSEAVTNTSCDVDGAIYVFDANGILCENRAGWIACKGLGMTTWYYVNAKGVAYTGWKAINGKWYYFDEDYGEMYNDQIGYIDNSVYGFSGSGAMVTGWYKPRNSVWYYFDTNGKGHTGWVKSGTTWYYTEDGRTYTGGIFVIDGKRCKFDAGGKWLGYV